MQYLVELVVPFTSFRESHCWQCFKAVLSSNLSSTKCKAMVSFVAMHERQILNAHDVDSLKPPNW